MKVTFLYLEAVTCSKAKINEKKPWCNHNHGSCLRGGQPEKYIFFATCNNEMKCSYLRGFVTDIRTAKNISVL